MEKKIKGILDRYKTYILEEYAEGDSDISDIVVGNIDKITLREIMEVIKENKERGNIK